MQKCTSLMKRDDWLCATFFRAFSPTCDLSSQKWLQKFRAFILIAWWELSVLQSFTQWLWSLLWWYEHHLYMYVYVIHMRPLSQSWCMSYGKVLFVWLNFKLIRKLCRTLEKKRRRRKVLFILKREACLMGKSQLHDVLFYNLPNWIDVGLLMVMCVHVLTLIKVLCVRTTYVRGYLVRWILSVLGALFRCFAKYANDAFVEFYVPLGKSSFQLMKTSGDSSPCWYRAHSVPDDALELIRRRRAICKTGP